MWSLLSGAYAFCHLIQHNLKIHNCQWMYALGNIFSTLLCNNFTKHNNVLTSLICFVYGRALAAGGSTLE